MKLYNEEHIWLDVEGDTATIGLTAFAVEELGEITFVELPVNTSGNDQGMMLEKGSPFCVIESMKAAADVNAPVNGRLLDINKSILSSPKLLNEDPETTAWLCKCRLNNTEELTSLMTEEQYKAFLKNEN